MHGSSKPPAFGARPAMLGVAAVLLAAGCGELTGPTDTGGERLAGTGDVGRRGFSVSRDGRYLFYPTASSTDAESRYALYRIGARRKTIVTADASLSERVRRYIPWFRRGCWGRGDDRHRVYLSNGAAVYFVDTRADEPSIRYDPDASDAEADFYYHCQGTVVEGVIRVGEPSDTEVRIVEDRPGGEVLASHTSWPFYTETVYHSDPSFSPDGRYYAYGISEGWGSFIGDAQGYLLDVRNNKGPYRLGKALYGPIRWGPEGRVFYGRFGLRDTSAIFRWKVREVIRSRQ